jgi:hypothetical protein
MKRLLVTAAACTALFWGATVATAGDHLACYKVKDVTVKQKIPNVQLLSNTGDVPSQIGCTISTRAKYCCDSVDKIGVPPQPGGGGPTGITNQFCCYKVKCPKGITGTLNVKDQFGTRSLPVAKPPSLVCAPSSPSGAFLDDAGF